MDNITNALSDFSDKYFLWALTEKCVLEAIDNCLTEERELELDRFPSLTSEDFVFERTSQTLIFNSRGHKTFIVRTNLDVYTNQGQGNGLVGTYSLDVNTNGEIVDDILHFY